MTSAMRRLGQLLFYHHRGGDFTPSAWIFSYLFHPENFNKVSYTTSVSELCVEMANGWIGLD